MVCRSWFTQFLRIVPGGGGDIVLIGLGEVSSGVGVGVGGGIIDGLDGLNRGKMKRPMTPQYPVGYE